MDNKTVFVRTKKGEEEMQGRTMLLPGGIKRALLMVDGNASFGEIIKRAAPSLRASLDEMFKELEKGGFILDKDQGQAVSEHIPKMSIPVKIATPHKSQPSASHGEEEELDFMSGFAATPRKPADKVPPANQERPRPESFDKSRQDAEVAKLFAQQGTAAGSPNSGQDSAKLLEDAVRRAKAEADGAKVRQQSEAERLKAEQEAVKMRIELAAAQAKAAQEAKARLEQTTAKAQARIEAGNDDARVREEAERIIRKEKEEAIAREAREREARELEAARVREEAERIIRKEKEEAIAREVREREARELEAARVREEAERIIRKEKEEALAREAREREAARIREEAERLIRKEQEEARVREVLEREAREREAARMREEAERLIRKEQEEARARESLALKEARVREEVERLRRQEQEEARARESLVLKEARVREEVERIMKQEQEEARAREAAAEERAARPAAPSDESSDFSFGLFEVDNPLYTSESHHKEKKSGKKDIPPAKKASPAPAAPAGKPGSFAFGSFNVDEHLQPQPQKNNQPAQRTAPVQQPAPASRAAQASEGRRPDKQQQADSVLTNKPVVGRPSQEQIRRAEQERAAVEQRMAADALATRKMAEDQAKVWAEAESRANEVARLEVDQVANHAAYSVDSSPAARSAPVARARRKQFSMGRLVGFFFKLGLFLLVLLVGALFIVPYVVPMRDYMPKAEQMLAEKLHQPVHVGRLSGRILPTPRLELGEIYIGDAKQFQADVAQINFSFMGVLTEEKPVNSIEFQGVKVRSAWLKNTAEWLQKMASDPKYPVSQIVITNGKLETDTFELAGIEGNLDFDPNGKFTQANLRANSGKYVLGINATPENKLHIALTVRGSALPLLPNWTFDVLNAKGELSTNDLVISDFDAKMLGGSVQGSGGINWRSNWSAQGNLNAKAINMQMLDKLMDGTVDGSARFRMASAGLGGLTDSVMLDGNFSSKDGTIGGMEIAETARKRSKENLPGGRIHYDQLTGAISFNDGVYHFKQTRISTSALSATSVFDVDSSKHLSGKMNVSLSLADRTSPPVDLQIGGTIDSPTLVYAP